MWNRGVKLVSTGQQKQDGQPVVESATQKRLKPKMPKWKIALHGSAARSWSFFRLSVFLLPKLLKQQTQGYTHPANQSSGFSVKCP